MEHTCECCQPAKSYKEKRHLRKHQKKYDTKYVFGGERSEVAKQLREANYLNSPVCCLHCSAVFSFGEYSKDRRKKYCDHRCASSHNNTRRVETTACAGCKIDCSKEYCSTECRNSVQYEKVIKDWLGGENGNQVCGAIKRPIRRYVLEEANYTCSECGWNKLNPTTGRIPVQIDHINGNSADSSYDNLRVLCPSCHSLTPTYGALNKGNGRKNRYKQN